MSPYCKILQGEPHKIPSKQQNGCNVAESGLTFYPGLHCPVRPIHLI